MILFSVPAVPIIPDFLYQVEHGAAGQPVSRLEDQSPLTGQDEAAIPGNAPSFQLPPNQTLILMRDQGVVLQGSTARGESAKVNKRFIKIKNNIFFFLRERSKLSEKILSP